MKVLFTADACERDPKTQAVLFEYKKGQEVELTTLGAAYYIALDVAKPVESVKFPVDAVAAADPAPADDAASAPVRADRRR